MAINEKAVQAGGRTASGNAAINTPDSTKNRVLTGLAMPIKPSRMRKQKRGWKKGGRNV